MLMMKTALNLASALLLSASLPAYARLGDMEEDLVARYGREVQPQVRTAPLLEESKELIFNYSGWRIRCALLVAKDGVKRVVRQEYFKLASTDPNTIDPSDLIIQDIEMNAILKAETGGGIWRETVPARSGEVLPPTATNPQNQSLSVIGKEWQREGGAIAKLSFDGISMVVEYSQASKHEAKVKAEREQNAREAKIPKF